MDQPLDRRATLRRFALPALVCSAILAASYQRTAEGTRHPSPWGYRLWSFGALAYSDIIALHEDRGAKAHPFPYLHDKVEYPVLMGLGIWWPSVLAPDRVGYFALTFAALALCALGVLWVLASLPQSQPWVWAASPTLLVYTALNWDLFGIMPLAAGLWLRAKPPVDPEAPIRHSSFSHCRRVLARRHPLRSSQVRGCARTRSRPSASSAAEEYASRAGVPPKWCAWLPRT